MGIIENERAQFMLLAGFIIAIGLVIATVMLNNIIFESNMAGEAGGDPIKYDLVNLMRISGDEMKSVYRNVTAPGQNPALNFSNFTKQMQNFNGNLSLIYALHGEGVNLSWDISNWNSTRYANFTENGTANGARNWTVIENVSSSSISMNVIVTSGTFQILLKNASSSLINLTAGTHTGLIFENSTGPYSISFINGSNAYGNYSIAGIASGKNFTRSRDYILNATIFFSTSDTRANITIPVSVPW